jgi:gamma-glutamyl-gamma-aminobutyrate hydrolase PuuD
LITARRQVRKNKIVDWVSEIHLSLLLREGLFPVVVPLGDEVLEALPEYTDGAAGLMLVEGGDIHPDYTGSGASVETLSEVDLDKDRVEFALMDFLSRERLPYLGFCRGNEVLNVSRGGTLYMEVSEELGGTLHLDPDNYDGHRHAVSISPRTPLSEWYRCERLMVNSYHRQGIKTIGRGLEPMAVAEDGLVEGVYDPSLPFCVGLQFHPERMLEEHEGNRRVFEAFGRAVRAASAAR